MLAVELDQVDAGLQVAKEVAAAGAGLARRQALEQHLDALQGELREVRRSVDPHPTGDRSAFVADRKRARREEAPAGIGEIGGKAEEYLPARASVRPEADRVAVELHPGEDARHHHRRDLGQVARFAARPEGSGGPAQPPLSGAVAAQDGGVAAGVVASEVRAEGEPEASRPTKGEHRGSALDELLGGHRQPSRGGEVVGEVVAVVPFHVRPGSQVERSPGPPADRRQEELLAAVEVPGAAADQRQVEAGCATIAGLGEVRVGLGGVFGEETVAGEPRLGEEAPGGALGLEHQVVAHPAVLGSAHP